MAYIIVGFVFIFFQLLQWSDNASSLMNEFERKSKLTASQLDDLSARVHTKAEKENVAKLYMRRDQHYEVRCAPHLISLNYIAVVLFFLKH